MKTAFRRTSRFTEFFAAENSLDLSVWAFLPGMLFMAPIKWWGDRGRRTLPHEGVDFRFYADPSGNILAIGEGSRIPAMFGGVVARIMDDFLGKSVVVAHGSPGKEKGPLLTIYGHTIPATGLSVGDRVEAGQVIATVVPVRCARTTVRPHLHVSAGTLSRPGPLDSLDWGNVNEALDLMDPLALIGDSYRLIEHA